MSLKFIKFCFLNICILLSCCGDKVKNYYNEILIGYVLDKVNPIIHIVYISTNKDEYEYYSYTGESVKRRCKISKEQVNNIIKCYKEIKNGEKKYNKYNEIVLLRNGVIGDVVYYIDDGSCEYPFYTNTECSDTGDEEESVRFRISELLRNHFIYPIFFKEKRFIELVIDNIYSNYTNLENFSEFTDKNLYILLEYYSKLYVNWGILYILFSPDERDYIIGKFGEEALYYCNIEEIWRERIEEDINDINKFRNKDRLLNEIIEYKPNFFPYYEIYLLRGLDMDLDIVDFYGYRTDNYYSVLLGEISYLLRQEGYCELVKNSEIDDIVYYKVKNNKWLDRIFRHMGNIRYEKNIKNIKK